MEGAKEDIMAAKGRVILSFFSRCALFRVVSFPAVPSCWALAGSTCRNCHTSWRV